MNAITETKYTRAWQDLGNTLPRPRAILVISAHWFVAGTAVTAMAQPRTIHDFGRFPKQLFDMQYPAPGDPALASEVADAIAPIPVRLDASWGLDHGAWSILVHAYPNADIPVVQLSIDDAKAPADHIQIGARLAPLRDRGVLILGSGNIVHNLAFMKGDGAAPYDWAVRFDDRIRTVIESGDTEALVNYESDPDARLAAPDVEHFLPVVYIAALRQPGENVEFIVDGLEMGSISMRSFRVG